MAPSFRSSPANSASPPSSFRNAIANAIRPVSSSSSSLTLQQQTASRRISRTDLDFEQALKNDETVVLKEGRDVESLGVTEDSTVTPKPKRASSTNGKMTGSYAAFAGRNESDGNDGRRSLDLPHSGNNNSSTGSSNSVTKAAQPGQGPNGSGVRSPSSSSSAHSPSTPLSASLSPNSTTSGATLGQELGQNRPRSRSPSAASTSSQERFVDMDDPTAGDVQTKRRSLLRSPGTASSPDLAMLVRRAKEKAARAAQKDTASGGGALRDGRGAAAAARGKGSSQAEEQRQTRARSSTTSDGKKSVKNRAQNNEGLGNINASNAPVSSDWGGGGGTTRQRSDTLLSKGKASVRSKTSAFLGKIIGQGSMRDKSRDYSSPTTPVSSSYSSSSFYQSDDAPPVPPLPKEHSRTPVGSPIADIFTNTSASNTPDLSKPLPVRPLSTAESSTITESDSAESIADSEASSIIADRIVSSVRPSSPERTIKGKVPESLSKKRRSLSVSEIDLKKALETKGALPSSSRSPLKNAWASGSGSDYSGMGELKGELSSQLDSFSTAFDLKDSATPRNVTSFDSDPTSKLAEARGRLHEKTSRPPLRLVSSSPVTATYRTGTPSLSIDTSRSSIEDANTASTGHASSSRAVSVSAVETRCNAVKFGPRMPRSGSSATASRDNSRLRVQHRSTASSSEPSLVPAREDDRSNRADTERTVRLVSSSASVGWPEATSPALSMCTSSQTDLTEETENGRMPSLSQSREEPVDMETKAKDLAMKCWTEDEDFLAREKIAEWLGGHKPVNKMALRHYVDNFDFAGLRLDVAFRRLCAKLYLKAETQQVDRILEEFSRRYWETNPTTLYGSASVVHAVSYSLLLLNTDLHVAELAQRMSRSQFVRNTLAAIQMQIRPSGPGRASTPELTHDDGSSVRGLGSDGSEAGASTLRSRGQRSGSVTSWNSLTRDFVNTPATTPNSGSSQTQLNGSQISVHEPRAKQAAPSAPVVYGRNFDSDMESLLREMYTAIKQQQILQPQGHSMERASISSGPGALLRAGSRRGQNDRVANLKRGSVRGIQSLFAAHAGSNPLGNNGSIDGRASPVPSFANSAHEVSMNAYASSSTPHFLAPTLGFASNLSHTIIRETQEDDTHSVHSDDSGSTTVSITDEELALFGAPWAKEGMLCRKQYWEMSGKRAKAKNWMNVFVVIQKGELNMFTFGEGGGGATMGVGGGNWLSNATPVGSVTLTHSLASALPSPGYSRQRPYCFVLTCSTGAVYFFQAGTEELVNEWVSTCNYWAARLSKEPLAGGVSNMEYGWNRVMDLEDDRPSSSRDKEDTFSMRSTRSWHNSVKDSLSARMHSDRVLIHDWKLPLPSTVASTHDEESQLEALQKHVLLLKSDLNKHNALRAPMNQLYAPRSTNASKAHGNWERKSQYLLTEIVKYDSYVDSLRSAMSLRLKKRGEKALEKALVSGNQDEANSSRKWKGYPEEETIPEGDEPPPTPGLTVSQAQIQGQAKGKDSRSSSRHRRESAET